MKHLPALDGLRGVAIVAVLAHDYNVVDDSAGSVAHAASLALDFGWVGVQLFFVLSGFLITGILLDTKRAAHYYRDFLARRALRILPLYYLVLVAAFVVTPLVWAPLPGSEYQGWLWVYLGNWVEPYGKAVPLFPHFWSLQIEEQFYLVWPLVVRALPVRALAWTCAGLAVAALASRAGLRAAGASPATAYMFTICRVDALVLGALGAIALRTPSVRAWLDARRALLRWGGLALVAVTIVGTRGAPRTGLASQTAGYTLFAVAFAAIVVAVALRGEGGRRGVLASAPLRAVGRYSYAMYIFHTPLHLLVGLPLLVRITDGAAPSLPLALGYAAGAAAATFVAGAISYAVVERPFLRLKDRLAPRAEGSA
jgi:peptidoglycan/LPS O-acetylase OafA/YrhL